MSIHKQALEQFNSHSLQLAAAASVLLNDEPPSQEDYDLWAKYLTKAKSSILYFEDRLQEIKSADDEELLKLVVGGAHE